MLCERCHKNQANTYITNTVNGVTKEMHLCGECAKQMGYGDLFSSFPAATMGLGDFFGSIFGETNRALSGTAKNRTCPSCGFDLADIARLGEVGCPQCYTLFEKELLPSIQNLQGSAEHTGKVPRSAGKNVRREKKIETLRAQMQKAVDNQEYEQAAKLRDEIKKLEKEESDHE